MEDSEWTVMELVDMSSSYFHPSRQSSQLFHQRTQSFHPPREASEGTYQKKEASKVDFVGHKLQSPHCQSARQMEGRGAGVTE